jgi:histidinol phosphatase-like PHP family hydrolase
LSVDSDAHSTERLGNVLYGVGVSHRAWVPPERVLNAPPPDEMLARLKSATRAGR